MHIISVESKWGSFKPQLTSVPPFKRIPTVKKKSSAETTSKCLSVEVLVFEAPLELGNLPLRQSASCNRCLHVHGTHLPTMPTQAYPILCTPAKMPTRALLKTYSDVCVNRSLLQEKAAHVVWRKRQSSRSSLCFFFSPTAAAAAAARGPSAIFAQGLVTTSRSHVVVTFGSGKGLPKTNEETNA